jgi:hypothetical protein
MGTRDLINWHKARPKLEYKCGEKVPFYFYYVSNDKQT